MEVQFKKLHENAQIPEYASNGAAAFDLFACKFEEYDHTENTCVVNTGIACAVPEGFVMLVFSRSGHGFKHGIRLANCVGVIDSDYRGEIKVKLARDTAGAIDFKVGDRIAQAMIVPCPQVTILEVEELDETERGDGGFGSTGDGEVQGRKFFGMPT